jgi:hypothetical protein
VCGIGPNVAEYRGGGVKIGALVALVRAVGQSVGKGVSEGKVWWVRGLGNECVCVYACWVRGLGKVCKGRGLAHAGLCRGVRMSERADRPSNTTKAIVRTSCRLHQISTRRL